MLKCSVEKVDRTLCFQSTPISDRHRVSMIFLVNIISYPSGILLGLLFFGVYSHLWFLWRLIRRLQPSIVLYVSLRGILIQPFWISFHTGFQCALDPYFYPPSRKCCSRILSMVVLPAPESSVSHITRPS